MIIEITIVILSLVFVGTSWILNDDEVSSISEKEEKIPQIDKLLDSVKEEKTEPKKAIPNFEKETSQIEELLKTAEKVKTKPKIETTKIECPGCNGTMEITKTGKSQNIICESCGLSGELEI